MRWVPLSDIVLKMRRNIPKVPHPDAADLRSRAALLTVMSPDVIGSGMPAPEWVNIAALTLSMPRPTAYRLTADASAQVRSTELRALPGEPPRILRSGWIVESRRPEKHSLFGSTASLGGYWLDDRLFLIGLDYPDGIRIESVAPKWEESEIGAHEQESPFVDDIHEQRAWAERAAEFIITLGALLDAEGTPIEVQDKPDKKGKKGSTKGLGASDDWIVRRVSLSPDSVRTLSSRTSEASDPSTVEDRELVETWVRGYLRRQPYGPGRSMRKWVYIREHQARRWVSSRPVRVDVDV